MKIPLFKIYWDEDDIKAVEGVIRSGQYWCEGSEIEEFEKKIADYIGVKYCSIFNSGGSALFALMKSYNFGKDDEIIVPSFTFIATAYAPLYVGAKPIFADIEEQTFGLDPEDVKKKITPKTKAIIPIHYGGMPCKIDELMKIAEENNLILIEDAAEAFGAEYKGQKAGVFGDSAIFSFCQNKIFTTSEGGCIVTNNKEIYEKAKLFRSYGRELNGNYFTSFEKLDYIDIGHNLRMSSLLAGLGISQLEKVDKLIEMRRENAQYLSRQLSGLNEIIVPDITEKDCFSVYQLYTIRILEGKEMRDKLMKYLTERGINTKIYFDSVHQHAVFKDLGYDKIVLPKTNKMSEQVLSLPIYPGLTKPEMDYIVENIINFFK